MSYKPSGADGSNPCRHIEKYAERRIERFLSNDELARLGLVLAKAEKERTELPSVLAAIRLLLFTGCRLSEILTLKWSHADLEKRCLHLPESKTGKKTVYLSPPALEVLAGLRTDGDHRINVCLCCNCWLVCWFRESYSNGIIS